MSKKNIIIVVSILAFILIVFGVSYSYFVYNKDIGDISLTTGDISIDLSGISGNQTLTNIIPLSDNEGKISSNYFDFTVNSTVDTERIYYEVYLLPDSDNTLNTNYLKTYLTDQANNELKGVTIYDNLGDSEVENGKVIYKGIVDINGTGTSQNETKAFRLRLWLDEEYSAQGSKEFDFDIYLYAKNVSDDYELPNGANVVREAILTKQNETVCNPVWTDMEDGIVYFSGTNDCVDMNYVWYSGKLWRIVAIYPDGEMKLITENNITTLAFNESDPNFYTNTNTYSYPYLWLNEEFYDSLYYAKNFVDTGKQWNITASNNISTRLANTNMVSSNVGLLNSYEYYNSYRCINSDNCEGTTPNTGYLNNGHSWWLLNPYDTNNGIMVDILGGSGYNSPSAVNGIRPVIVLKADVEFTGDGTVSSPFKIVGDKKVSSTNQD